MAAEIHLFRTRIEWLEARKSFIGGSDAAAVIGQSPYKSNVELWEEKSGLREPEDISGKAYVQYGTKAEQYLRELFRLDFPEYQLDYQPGNLWTNEKFPWAHASLDGWLTDPDGRRGVWECKTGNISSKVTASWWDDRIPQQYYCQVLHYLMVTEFDFVVLKAQLRYPGEDRFTVTKHYFFERANLEEDIRYLADREREFAIAVREKRRPALILPELGG